MQMEIEVAALKKEDDRLSQERLEELQKELAELKEDFSGKKAQWDNEKASVEKLSRLREEIDEVNSQIQIAQREGNLEKAAELLKQIEQTGLFATLEQGIFADIKRPRDGGKGLAGVCGKQDGYYNPFVDMMVSDLEGGNMA